MVSSRSAILAFLAAVVLGLLPVGAGDATAVRLWRPDSLPAGYVPRPEAITSQAIFIDTLRLDSDPDSVLAFPLAAGDSLNVERVRRERPGGNKLVWFGRIVGQPRSSVTIARVRGVVVGNVTTQDGRRFRIRYAGGGLHVLEDVDPGQFPDEAEPRLAALSTGPGGESLACTTDDPRQIDLLVVYTADALALAGGADAMEASIHMMVGDANQSYMNSDVEPRIRLVHFEQVVYTETGVLGYDLDALQLTAAFGEPDLDDVHDLRNEVGADAVVLLVKNPGTECGLANIIETLSTDQAEDAFAVVGFDCAIVEYTFAHELGHIMAARHDWFADGTSGPFPDNRGFIHKDLASAPKIAWRTMMALARECTYEGITDANCGRLLFWSNPAKYRDGVSMGSSTVGEQADNHRILNASAASVSNFRCARPTRKDAWMKDAWSDSGDEPEPGLAGEPMWKSPYIWVRNTADSDLIHAHDHENPIRGRENHVFVKIHGGTSAITGSLQLYSAKASSGLDWMSDWTLEGSVSLAPLDAYDTRIVHFPWTPTEDGHFCLVARWDAGLADPMTTPEGTEIEANVRGNNNIVWRNVNIVELDSGETSAASLYMANPGKVEAMYSLTILPAHAGRDADFLNGGGLKIRLDRSLRNALIGQKALEGLRPPRDYDVKGDDAISASAGGIHLRGIRIPPRSRIPLRLTFSRPLGRGLRTGTYSVDVIQTEMEPRRRKVIGGVTYEIRILGPRRLHPIRDR